MIRPPSQTGRAEKAGLLTQPGLAVAHQVLLLMLVIALGGCGDKPPAPTAPGGREVRCAVIGGMVETGMWDALSKRFEADTGLHVRLIATGPKGILDEAVRANQVDLVTMHSSDTIINFVAEGLAENPQPWLRNDLVIVGPSDDPARIRGLTDAGQAMRQIVDSGCPFVVHASIGSQEVLRYIMRKADVVLDEETTTFVMAESARQVLRIAAQQHAYTLVGRIPFLGGKMPNAGLELMVQGDPLLRRPYLVTVINPRKVKGVNEAGARRLAEYLRAPATQKWIAEFGRGVIDDKPLFFAVDVE